MTTIQRIRVPAGFAYSLLYLYLARPEPVAYWTGLGVVGLGIVARLWASGHLVKFQRLVISGPYRWCRNPLYLGSFIIGLGFSVAGASIWLILLFLAVFFAVYLPVMSREEEELGQSYGSDYSTYAMTVPRFLPRKRVRLSPEIVANHFQWKTVVSNREYRAIVGVVVLAVLVYAKMILA